ncbi:MAG: hypothetical protein ABIH72_02685 [archaeon]
MPAVTEKKPIVGSVEVFTDGSRGDPILSSYTGEEDFGKDPPTRGMQFEIWLELLLKEQEYPNVIRNVEFRKERYVMRQVDVAYDIVKQGRLYKAVVEAKYCANGRVKDWTRGNGGKRKAGQTIRNIGDMVDEFEERLNFVGADYAFLATNKIFDDKVKAKAESKGIRVVERRELMKVFSNLGYKGDMEDSILSINPDEHNQNKNIIYIGG